MKKLIIALTIIFLAYNIIPTTAGNSQLILPATITPFEDIGDWHQIDTPLGVVGIREGEDRCWISSMIVTENSIIFANLQTVDQTATSAYATEQTSGSFVLRLDRSASANVRVNFLVVTPE